MTRIVVVAPLLVLISAAGEAQTVNPPARFSRPPVSEGTTRTLEFDSSLYAGYDRNLVATDVTTVDATAQNGTFRGWGSANLKFNQTSGEQAFDVGVGATGSTATYGRNRGAGRVYGTNVNTSFRSPVGSSTNLSMTATANRTPYYSQGLFAALPPGSYSPDANPVNSIVDGNLWFVNSSATLSRSIARHTAASATYSFSKNLYEGGSSDLSTNQHTVLVNISQQVSRSNQLQGSYHVAGRDAAQGDAIYNGLAHGFSLGFRRSQDIGPTRTLSMSVGGGGELVDAGSTARYWQPTYNASIGTDIGRTWVVSFHYTQTSALLSSPLSAPETYLTQLSTISVGGYLLNNLDVTMNAGISHGSISASNSITGTGGSYLAINGNTQLRVDLTSFWSTVVSVNYYRSDMDGAAAAQFPVSSGIFRRVSARVGFAWRVPIMESGRRIPDRGRGRGRSRRAQ